MLKWEGVMLEGQHRIYVKWVKGDEYYQAALVGVTIDPQNLVDFWDMVKEELVKRGVVADAPV